MVLFVGREIVVAGVDVVYVNVGNVESDSEAKFKIMHSGIANS